MTSTKVCRDLCLSAHVNSVLMESRRQSRPFFPSVLAQCPRQDSNLVFDLRRVACDPPHSEDSCDVVPLRTAPVPRRGFEPRPAASNAAVHPPHSQGAAQKTQNAKHPPAHPPRRSGSPGCITSVSRPGFEPGPGPSEGPMRSVTPSRQIKNPSQHEREESNPVRRFWRPPALPGAHSCFLVVLLQLVRATPFGTGSVSIRS